MQSQKHTLLYPFICATFTVVIVLGNIVSVKIICCFENFKIPAGLVMFPLTFLMTDFVTELFGKRQAKAMVYIAFALSIFSFALFRLVISLPGHDEQISSALESVLSYNGSFVISSLIAYLLSQLIDIHLFTCVRKLTGEKMLWLRNNVSTLVSQFVDTLVVCFILFYWAMGMALGDVMTIALHSYVYKAMVSVAFTPLFYLAVFTAKRYTKSIDNYQAL